MTKEKDKEAARKVFNIRLLKSEVETIEAQMMQLCLKNKSKFIRDKALSRLKDKSYLKLVSQLNLFNSNFNQAVRALNTIQKSANKNVFNFDLIAKHLEECAQSVKRIEESAE